jgi:hypothetical protein
MKCVFDCGFTSNWGVPRPKVSLKVSPEMFAATIVGAGPELELGDGHVDEAEPDGVHVVGLGEVDTAVGPQPAEPQQSARPTPNANRRNSLRLMPDER